MFAVSYFVHYNTLLQNATDITTRDSYFMTKCGNSLLQNAPSFSLQNVAVLLQIATVKKLQNSNIITKWVGTYIVIK